MTCRPSPLWCGAHLVRAGVKASPSALSPAGVPIQTSSPEALPVRDQARSSPASDQRAVRAWPGRAVEAESPSDRWVNSEGQSGDQAADRPSGQQEAAGAWPAADGPDQGQREGRGKACSKFHYWIKGGPTEAGRAPPRRRPSLLSSAPLWAAPLAAQQNTWRSTGSRRSRTSCPALPGQVQADGCSPFVRAPRCSMIRGGRNPSSPHRSPPMAKCRPVRAGLTEPARPYSRQLSGSPAGVVPRLPVLDRQSCAPLPPSMTSRHKPVPRHVEGPDTIGIRVV